MGVCDLRIGYTEGLYFGGHIGYSIDPEFRGHHYAAQACELLFLLAAKHHMPYLIISCNPDNWPSRKTAYAALQVLWNLLVPNHPQRISRTPVF